MSKIILIVAIIGVGVLGGIYYTHYNSQDGNHHEVHGTNNELTLNHGKKWKADEPTRQHMRTIRDMLQQNKSESDYSALHSRLKNEIDQTFQDCQMVGEEHNQLHKLLSKLITANQQLMDKSKSAQAYEDLRNDIKLFDNYFE